MQYDGRATSLQWRMVVFVGLLGLSLVGILRFSSAARSDPGVAAQQDVIRLENRITQLEQRLFSIENSLRNLEQQSRLAAANVRGVNVGDLARLQLEIQALSRRVAEHECGLAKLDERTLTPGAREARRKASGSSDPCRLNFQSPLRLSVDRQ